MALPSSLTEFRVSPARGSGSTPSAGPPGPAPTHPEPSKAPQSHPRCSSCHCSRPTGEGPGAVPPSRLSSVLLGMCVIPTPPLPSVPPGCSPPLPPIFPPLPPTSPDSGHHCLRTGLRSQAPSPSAPLVRQEDSREGPHPGRCDLPPGAQWGPSGPACEGCGRVGGTAGWGGG